MPIPLVFIITDLDLGGCPLLLRTLAVGLPQRAHFVPTVISLQPPRPLADMLRADSIPVHTLNLTSPLQLPRALFRLVSLLRQIRPAVVHSMLIHANLLAYLASYMYPRPTYIPSLHTLQPKPRWHWWLQRTLLFFTKRKILLAPSQEILKKVSFNLARRGGNVVQNGINVAFYRFERASNPLHFPPSTKVVGYLGRFDPIKRLPLLIQAIAHIINHNPSLSQDLHLVLVGYGPQEPHLRALANSLHIAPHVHFPGPTREPQKWYKSFNCLCLPSAAEGQPLTILEAFAAGLPIIATDLPAIRQITQDDARLISPVTPESLALAITEVISSPPPSEEALKARYDRLAATYSQEAMISAYEKIFKDFCPA